MPSDELKILAWAPGALFYGKHFPYPLPLSSAIAQEVDLKRKEVIETLSVTPGAFDGDRACLTSWRITEKGVYIETAWRSYSEGIAIREIYKKYCSAGTALSSGSNQPDPLFSWGSTYTSVVLLPDNKVLAGLRSPNMATNGNVWSVAFTEILEPTDVSEAGMSCLPIRLVKEEMPALLKYGTPKLVGIGVREFSYTWQLIGVLDLRDADTAIFETIAKLPSDEETIAWRAVSIFSHDTENILGKALAEDLVTGLGKY